MEEIIKTDEKIMWTSTDMSILMDVEGRGCLDKMTKFENETLLQLLSMKAKELEEISKTEEDINIDDGIMFQISKQALLDFSERIKNLRSEIFFVNTKLG